MDRTKAKQSSNKGVICVLDRRVKQYDVIVRFTPNMSRKTHARLSRCSVHFSHFITELKIQHLYSLILLFQATKALHKAFSARQDLSFKGPRVQSALSAPTERSLVKFGGLTEKRTKDQKALVHQA